MKKQRKFLIGGTVVIGLVGYLMVTGMRDAMLFYYTPDELAAMVTADPTYHDVPVKVGGRVVPGSVTYDPMTLDLRFDITDIETGATTFGVAYNGPRTDTFKEGGDVVIEGLYREDGVFAATSVITKCGSRYEAGAEDALS